MNEKSPKIRQKRELISAKQAGKKIGERKVQATFYEFHAPINEIFGIERPRNCFVLMNFGAR